MAIATNYGTHDHYVNLLKQAADEIKLRADDMIGEVDGVRQITVQINIEPASVVTIDATKSYLSGFNQTTPINSGDIITNTP